MGLLSIWGCTLFVQCVVCVVRVVRCGVCGVVQCGVVCSVCM